MALVLSNQKLVNIILLPSMHIMHIHHVFQHDIEQIYTYNFFITHLFIIIQDYDLSIMGEY